MEERLVSSELQNRDSNFEQGLRPGTLKEYIGQSQAKHNLSVYIEAAKRRGEPLDHVLLYGPPGLGKTTLAGIIARELGVDFRTTSGPAIERPGDLAAILTNLGKGDILFIDEVHRLSRPVEEILYPAMEDSALDIVVGKGPSARSLRLTLSRFTLVGATTRIGLLSSPLRDRFGIVSRLDFYTGAELKEIVRRSAKILGIQVSDDGAREIAGRSRGTPRVANRLLKRVRDFALVWDTGIITKEVAEQALEEMNIDSLGLDAIDRQMLSALINKFKGGPVGLDTLAASISEAPDTVGGVYEPYLLKLGFLKRTPRGRVATRLAYEHLGIKYREVSEQRLF